MLRINLLPGGMAAFSVGGWLSYARGLTDLNAMDRRLHEIQPLLVQTKLDDHEAEARHLIEACGKGERAPHLLLWRAQDFFAGLRRDGRAVKILESHPTVLQHLRNASRQGLNLGPYRGDAPVRAIVPAGGDMIPRPEPPSSVVRAARRSGDWVRLGGRWVWGGLQGAAMIPVGLLFLLASDKPSVNDAADEMDTEGWLRKRFSDPWRLLASADVWKLQDRAERGDVIARNRLSELARKGDPLAAAVLQDFARRDTP